MSTNYDYVRISSPILVLSFAEDKGQGVHYNMQSWENPGT